MLFDTIPHIKLIRVNDYEANFDDHFCQLVILLLFTPVQVIFLMFNLFKCLTVSVQVLKKKKKEEFIKRNLQQNDSEVSVIKFECKNSDNF